MSTSIIFSKDRALQLDLTLKSIKENLLIFKHAVVLYTTSDVKHQESYNILKEEHPEIDFVKQGPKFFEDILTCLYVHNDKYIVLFTDDNIVYKKSETTKEDLNEIFNSPLVSCLSLRLGINITKRDFGDGVFRPDIRPPKLERLGTKFLYWNRTTIPVGGYWAYPLSVDGHVYKREDISYIFHTMNGWPESSTCIQNANKLESYMQRFFFEVPIGMCCEKESCVVNSPNNRVQESHKNVYGLHFDQKVDMLNRLFLNGTRLQPSMFANVKIYCPHQELDLINGL